MKDYKKVITEFYRKYNPEQLDRVDYLLTKYKGREEDLLNMLHAKYVGSEVAPNEENRVVENKQRTVENSAPKAAPKSEPAKKVQTKSDWEKRREEILKQVRDRAENLKKVRETIPPPASKAEKIKETAASKPKEEPVTKPKEEPVSKPREEKAPEPATAAKNPKEEKQVTTKAAEQKKAPETPPVKETIKSEGAFQAKKKERNVARYDSDAVKPKLQIPNPGSMSASERAAFWQQQLEIREKMKMQKMSEAAIKTKYEEPPEPEPEKKKERKAIPQAPPPAEKKTKSKSGSARYVWMALLIVVLAGGIYAIWHWGFHRSADNLSTENIEGEDKLPKKTAIPPEGVRTPDEENETGNEEMNNAETEPSASEEDMAVTDEEEEAAQEDNSVGNEAEIPPAKAGELRTPCFVVSYSTLSSEDAATAAAAALRAKGFKAGYYFIPDYVPGGKSLYKVYAGPFSTQEAAEAEADRIRSFSEGAYVIYLQ